MHIIYVFKIKHFIIFHLSSCETCFDESTVRRVNHVFVNRSTIGSVFVMFQTAFCSQIPFDSNENDNLKVDFQNKFILFQCGLIVAQESALSSTHMFNLIQHLWLFFQHSPA